MSEASTGTKSMAYNLVTGLLPAVQEVTTLQGGGVVDYLKDLTLNRVGDQVYIGVFAVGESELWGRAFVTKDKTTDSVEIVWAEYPTLGQVRRTSMTVSTAPSLGGHLQTLASAVEQATDLLNSIPESFDSIIYLEGGENQLYLRRKDGVVVEYTSESDIGTGDLGPHYKSWFATEDLVLA